MVSGLYPGNPGTYFDDYARAFMSGNAGKGRHGKDAVEDGEIRVADPRRLILD
jgi:hypothetical protein